MSHTGKVIESNEHTTSIQQPQQRSKNNNMNLATSLLTSKKNGCDNQIKKSPVLPDVLDLSTSPIDESPTSSPPSNRRNSLPMETIVGTLWEAFETTDRLHQVTTDSAECSDSFSGDGRSKSDIFEPIRCTSSVPIFGELGEDGSATMSVDTPLTVPSSVTSLLSEPVRVPPVDRDLDSAIPSATKILPLMSDRLRFQEPQTMPASYSPGANDIICGRRTKQSQAHAGNIRFKDLIRSNIQNYQMASTMASKSLVIISIVDTIRDAANRGYLVKEDKSTGRWIDIGDRHAREKVGFAIRDLIKAKKKSQARQAKRA